MCRSDLNILNAPSNASSDSSGASGQVVAVREVGEDRRRLCAMSHRPQWLPAHRVVIG